MTKSYRGNAYGIVERSLEIVRKLTEDHAKSGAWLTPAQVTALEIMSDDIGMSDVLKALSTICHAKSLEISSVGAAVAPFDAEGHYDYKPLVKKWSKGADLICATSELKIVRQISIEPYVRVRGERVIRQAGRAIFGAGWHGPLARALDVSLRSVQRWAGEKVHIPPGVWPELANLCRAHRKHLCRVVQHDLDVMVARATNVPVDATERHSSD